jgi:hypothetical protein
MRQRSSSVLKFSEAQSKPSWNCRFTSILAAKLVAETHRGFSPQGHLPALMTKMEADVALQS